MRNPVPIILAGIGAALLVAAAYLPAITFDGDADSAAFIGLYSRVPHPVADSTVGLALLAITFAAAVALHNSSQWLQFGRLATWGVAVTVTLAGFSQTHNWMTNIQTTIESGSAGGPEGSGQDPVELTFDIGLWLFLAGVMLVAAATVFIRTPPPGPPRFHPQQPPMMAPQQPPPAPAGPPAPQYYPPQTPPASAGDDKNVTVHDDPPSMSIYKPPQPR